MCPSRTLTSCLAFINSHVPSVAPMSPSHKQKRLLGNDNYHPRPEQPDIKEPVKTMPHWPAALVQVAMGRPGPTLAAEGTVTFPSPGLSLMETGT